MSKAKFEAFQTALVALCEEHKVRLWGCEDGEVGVSDEHECLDAVDLYDGTAMSPEERAAREAEIAAMREQQEQERRDRMVEWAKRNADSVAALQECADYRRWDSMASEHALKQRKEDMRVSTDPTDPAYIDARPRKAWCNDIEVIGWTVADEFRRCVITPERVYNGSVRVERLPAVVDAPTEWPTIDITQVAEDTVVLPITSLPKVKQETFKGKRR
jgi:hypothetical protein